MDKIIVIIENLIAGIRALFAGAGLEVPAYVSQFVNDLMGKVKDETAE